MIRIIPIVLFLIGAILFLAFSENPFSWSKYEVKKSKELTDFVMADSMMDEGKKVKIEDYQRDARASYWIYSKLFYKDINKDSLESLLPFTMPCECTLKNDTILIYSGIGVNGGLGTFIQIHKKEFTSGFFHYIDDVKFKRNLSDTTDEESITLASSDQYLRLFTKPQFKLGERITGLLTYSTPTYFIYSPGMEMESNQIEAKLQFTCLLEQTY